jgi:hypothetical protein
MATWQFSNSKLKWRLGRYGRPLLEGVPPSPSPRDSIPASKVLETSLVCTRSAQFALSSGVNDDFTCNKVEKKFASRVVNKRVILLVVASFRVFKQPSLQL